MEYNTKRLIFIPLAFDLNKQSEINVSDKADKLQIYMKNACNALIFAKKYNLECTVAWVINLTSEDLLDYEIELLNNNNIKLISVQYFSFVFPTEYGMLLAFYKLCALSHLVKSTEY